MKTKGMSELLRDLLRDNEDGLTIEQLIDLSGANDSFVRRTLASMPDVYVGGWIRTSAGLGFIQAYKAAKIPKDVRRPVITKEMMAEYRREREKILYHEKRAREVEPKSSDYKPKTSWVK